MGINDFMTPWVERDYEATEGWTCGMGHPCPKPLPDEYYVCPICGIAGCLPPEKKSL